MLIKPFLSQNKKFYFETLKIAIPVTIQSALMFLANALDIFMISSLGEQSISAIKLANQLFFIFIIFSYGLTSASAVLTGQEWGNKNIKAIKTIQSLTIIITSILGLIFISIGLFFPFAFLSLYGSTQEITVLATQYLKYSIFSFLFTGISLSFNMILQSIGQAKLSLYATIIAVISNIILNYIFIFGKFSFPQMGIMGAGLGTLLARILEFFFLVFIINYKKLANQIHFKNFAFKNFKPDFLKRFNKITIPTFLNEISWGLGITTFNMIFARLGPEVLSAISIADVIKDLAFVSLQGLSVACSVMISQNIGEKKIQQAKIYGQTYIILGFLLSIILGIIIALLSPFFINTFFSSLSAQTKKISINFIYIMCLVIFAKGVNFIIIIGILRAGGDSFFTMLVDFIPIWFIGIPLAFCAAFVWQFNPYIVILLAYSEEIIKFFVVIYRFYSFKWIHEMYEKNINVENVMIH